MKKLDKLIHRTIGFIFNLIHIKPKDKTVQDLSKFFKFSIVGLTNTVLSYVVHIFVLIVLKPYEWRWDYVIANLLSFFISVTWSFYWNNKYVFLNEKGQKRNILHALIRTYISYAFTGILLSNILSLLLIEKLGFSKFNTPLLKLIITVPLNFLIVKKWAFRPQYHNKQVVIQDENESR